MNKEIDALSAEALNPPTLGFLYQVAVMWKGGGVWMFYLLCGVL
jgi:hypothetical protein